MNEAGVCAVVGGYASAICLSATQTAARYDLPYVVDVGVVDSIVTRGLKNTFRFGPGFGVIAKTALDNLVSINDQAGKPAISPASLPAEDVLRFSLTPGSPGRTRTPQRPPDVCQLPHCALAKRPPPRKESIFCVLKYLPRGHLNQWHDGATRTPA